MINANLSRISAISCVNILYQTVHSVECITYSKAHVNLMSVKSPLGLVVYCYLNMPTINKTYLILSYLILSYLILPQNGFCVIYSPLVFSGVRVTRSLILCVCFVDRCLSFLSFFFWSLYCFSFFYLRILVIFLWYLQTHFLIILRLHKYNLSVF